MMKKQHHKLLRRREGDYMRKRVFLSAIVIVIFIPLYYLVLNTSNETILHTDINVADVESITINDRTYNNKNDSEIITKIISFYNSARIYKRDDGTTPSHLIEIRIKNGQKINVAGTTQGFHYVSYAEKSYKISSTALSQYLRDCLR
jgi:hypothetical protein